MRTARPYTCNLGRLAIHGYIHAYCAVAFAEYLIVLSLYNIFLSVVLTLHFLVYLCYWVKWISWNIMNMKTNANMFFLLLFIFNSFTKNAWRGNGRSGTAVFCDNLVAICIGVCGYGYIHGYPWIYPWISTENLWIWIWIWMANFISTASLIFSWCSIVISVKAV